MALLKEDGSLDVERINRLPLEEHKREVESLNQSQFKEYYSKRILNESQSPVRIIKVNYGFDDKRSGVDAIEFLNKLEKKYSTNNEA